MVVAYSTEKASMVDMWQAPEEQEGHGAARVTGM